MSIPDNLPSLSGRLRAAREARGLTQSDIARVFGIDAKAVAQWERDLDSRAKRKPARPDIARLPVLADALGVTLDWLLRGADAPSHSHHTPPGTVDLVVGSPPFARGGLYPKAPGAASPEAYVAALRAHLDQMRRLAGPGAKIAIVDPASRALRDAHGRTLARIVPFVGRVAAGPWLDAEPPYPFDATDDRVIFSTVALGEKVFALEIVGDSMSKLYKSGDRIVIDPDRVPRPRADDVVVKLADSNDPDYRVTLKRLVKIELDAKNNPRRLLLEGRPANGEPDRLDLAARRAQILGTVVEHLPKAA